MEEIALIPGRLSSGHRVGGSVESPPILTGSLVGTSTAPSAKKFAGSSASRHPRLTTIGSQLPPSSAPSRVCLPDSFTASLLPSPVTLLPSPVTLLPSPVILIRRRRSDSFPMVLVHVDSKKTFELPQLDPYVEATEIYHQVIVLDTQLKRSVYQRKYH